MGESEMAKKNKNHQFYGQRMEIAHKIRTTISSVCTLSIHYHRTIFLPTILEYLTTSATIFFTLMETAVKGRIEFTYLDILVFVTYAV